MPYEFGDVVLVRFPFTSQFHSPSGLGEALISQWQAANLLKPSVIKPVFATLERGLILKHLGVLQPSDQSALRQAIAAVLE